MQYVLAWLGVLAILAFGLKAFTRANPATLARRLRVLGGIVVTGAAGLLAARGQFHLALLLLAILGPLLLGRAGGLFGRTAKSGGQTSRVDTALVRMHLEHDTGAMDGEVLTGPQAGRTLGTLSLAEILDMLAACRGHDPQSEALLEAYLDHSHVGWRDATEAAGGAQEGGAGRAAAGSMTAAEARRVLGVGSEAGDEEIHSAWRQLMKRNHPDHGGSAYLAAKINEAKEVLLGKSA